PGFDPAARPPAPPPAAAPPTAVEPEVTGGGSRLPLLLGGIALVLVAALVGVGWILLKQGGGAAAAGTGVLIVGGSPTGAKVVVNGTPAGELPYVDSSALVGSYEVRVEADGYEPYTQRVVVAPGETAKVTVALKPAAKATAKVLVVSEPLDAKVLLDGEVVKEGGPAPWQASDVEAGKEHEIVVQKPGYRDARFVWTPEPGEEKTFTARLAPALVRLRVESEPAGATVYLDGAKRGRTPLDLEQVDATKQHRLEIDGGRCYERWSSTLIFDERAERTVRATLERSPACATRGDRAPGKKRSSGTAPAPRPKRRGKGKLMLNMRGAWANVWIDGKDTGKQTPLINYELPAGTHRIELKLPDGRSTQLTVEIQPNETVKKTVPAP
ncbi:MAG: PEGA domain-containing protein, partial [Deltaproteobacteria bacterium]